MRRWNCFLVTLLFPVVAVAQSNPWFAGTWVLDKERSSDIDPWRKIVMDIGVNGKNVTIKRFFSSGRYQQGDSMRFTTGGVLNRVPVRAGKWPNQVHLGVYIGPESTKEITAEWVNGTAVLRVVSHLDLQTSQGTCKVTTTSEYRLSADAQILTVTEKRSTRPNLLTYVFTRVK